ncbi:hypothetical protein [Flavobacterium sp. JP2137]|uniref:hypothetical protein n=1 Tax=Flavobacterium sp. JP2137 TaxID=3414510 RepID=UPI003D3011CE
MKTLFYLPVKAVNDATIYYTDLIKRAFVNSGWEVTTEQTVDRVNEFDVVVTIRVRDFLKVYLKNSKLRIINWQQGIGPEEYAMLNQYSLRAKAVSSAFSMMEKWVLKKSYYCFLVSTSMLKHYREKYDIALNNHIVVPCYNKNLQPAYFDQSLKEASSFVYAGTLFSWQCFERTVALYQKIEQKNPEASLTVFTKEKEAAREILNRYHIKNSQIRYVSLAQLDQELSTFKYGFILRDQHPVNAVSTPTKMNSYLSVGLMPIYTDVIESFEEHLNLAPYCLKFKANDSLEFMADAIDAHNKKTVDYPDFLKICQENFKGYYDDAFNISKIEKELIDGLKTT